MRATTMDCPHCHTQRSGFELITTSWVGQMAFLAIFACNGCRQAVCMHIAGNSVQFDNEFRSLESYLSDSATLIETYPVARKVSAPHDIPPAAERAFLQAVHSARASHFDAAAAMYRKAIDVASRALDEKLADKLLAARIDALHAAGKLTDDLKDWAHLIRLDGNQGAHDDEELTKAQVTQLGSFTELFLTYTFTLPAQVKARRTAAEGK